jgi:hypothetical protein
VQIRWNKAGVGSDLGLLSVRPGAKQLGKIVNKKISDV